MDTFSKVIPGKVLNQGIVSKENLSSTTPIISSPAHFPDFAAVTPKGEIDRTTASVSTFTEKYGDCTDPYGLYYNPITYAIQKLGSAGQDSFGFKRLVNNQVYSRVILGVTVFKDQQVPNYKRDSLNDYILGDDGNAVVDTDTPTISGVFASPGILLSKGLEIGAAKPLEVTATATGTGLPEGAKGTFYPLKEIISGIGDAYNSSYAVIGHKSTVDWDTISDFVTTNGVFPFTLNIGTLQESGLRVVSSTTNGVPDTTFTMFDMVDSDSVKYSLSTAISAYTGNNVNRQVELTAAPFKSVYDYNAYTNQVAQILYDAEYVSGAEEAPVVKSQRVPKHAIMNMFSFVNHHGKPYKHIVFGGNVGIEGKVTGTRVSINHYLQSNGGINPYADAEGNFPDAPSNWSVDTNGEWIKTAEGNTALLSHAQCWEMTQTLLLAWFTEYQNSLQIKDVIRNRTSFLWDLGYRQDVKLAMIPFLSKRKDLIVVMDAGEYLKTKTQDQIYSAATMLYTRLSMIPESSLYNTGCCRASINLWDSRYINESRWGRFSLNIDLMYAFAMAGGGADGKIYKSLMPDHEGNRALRIAHDPLIQFENDDPAANNLVQGCISVTPLNSSGYCRAALPTVYSNTDSVLKDLTNVWKCVAVEKILQDLWINVSGDTQLGEEGYSAYMKDNAEKLISTRFGSIISSWEVVPTFKESGSGSKSIMYCTTKLWFGKGVYMMDSVLEAYNEDSLSAE